MADHEAGKLRIRTESETKSIEPGFITLTTRDERISASSVRPHNRPHRIRPRRACFVEECGIEFSSEDRTAFPKLSPVFESTVARNLRDRRAGGLSADKHWHEPGP